MIPEGRFSVLLSGNSPLFEEILLSCHIPNLLEPELILPHVNVKLFEVRVKFMPFRIDRYFVIGHSKSATRGRINAATLSHNRLPNQMEAKMGKKQV
jgi:hypothetical protein